MCFGQYELISEEYFKNKSLNSDISKPTVCLPVKVTELCLKQTCAES